MPYIAITNYSYELQWNVTPFMTTFSRIRYEDSILHIPSTSKIVFNFLPEIWISISIDKFVIIHEMKLKINLKWWKKVKTSTWPYSYFKHIVIKIFKKVLSEEIIFSSSSILVSLANWVRYAYLNSKIVQSELSIYLILCSDWLFIFKMSTPY